MTDTAANEAASNSSARCYEASKSGGTAANPWLVTDGVEITHGQLHDRIGSVGALLKQRGIPVRSRIIIATSDDKEAAMLFIALICHGITAVNLDANTGPERAAALIVKSEPALLIVDSDLKQRWSLAAMAIPLLEITSEKTSGVIGRLLGRSPQGGLLAELAALDPVPPPASIPADTIAYIMFTSGTTSRPKGVCISHRALFSHLETLAKLYEYTPRSRILNPLMLSHADGMIQGPVMAFFTGATVHRPMPFEVATVSSLLDAVYQARITHMIAVPTMLALMLRLGRDQRDSFQGGDFRLMVSCGAQLESTLQIEFVDTFGVTLMNVYGLTETTVGGVFARTDNETGTPGGIGQPVDCELRIVNDAGHEVQRGEAGELIIRGELLMSGYFDEPDLTAAALRDGWLHTGDIALLGDDQNYRICGRRKNIVVRGGYNIHPEEITEVLQRHPNVTETVTFGRPDRVWGETVVSLIVAHDVEVPELHQYCSVQLEPMKLPDRIIIVPRLPRGRSGKVLLDEARALADDAETVAAMGQSAEEIEDRVLDVAARCFKQPRNALRLTDSPDDITGWDSLAHMEFVVAIEAEFGIVFSARDIMGLTRLDKVLPLVKP